MNRPVVRLYVLRHGEPEDPGIFYGHLDVRLSALGEAQVKAQCRTLAGVRFSEIHASDLVRARAGAEALAAAQQASDRVRARGGSEALAAAHDGRVRATPALREMHLGCLEGLPQVEARERYPEIAQRSYLDMLDFRMPAGGESVSDTAARVEPYVAEVLERCWSSENDACVLVYAHNTVNRILLGAAAGCGAAGFGRFSQQYGAINRIDVSCPKPGEDRWSRATIVLANGDPDSGVGNRAGAPRQTR